MAESGRKSGAGDIGTASPKKSGVTVDPGPYEAIVQGHVQGTRMGQLIVTIPDWGGVINAMDSSGVGSGDSSQSNQIVVSYASPFYGTTYGTDTGLTPSTPQTAGQSYGFWCVPPDIGNKVLVTFVAGDLNRGYWFACIYDSPSHHMVPGNGRNIGGASATATPPASDGVNSYFNSSSNLPVVEYDISDPNAFTPTGLTTTPRYPHEFQAMAYVKQGLDQDTVRGAISSSSMREAPSNVYGISTPGKAAGSTPQDSGDPQASFFRTGGHSFVMDDGSSTPDPNPNEGAPSGVGTDQLIRLRTSAGHQILMNDTQQLLYIASASGQQWLEFSNDGSINVYGAAGFNLRSSGAINMHSDAGISMCAPTIAMNAIPSMTGISLPSITLNSMGTVSVSSIMKTSVSADAGCTVSSLGIVSVTAGGALSLGSLGMTSVTATGMVKIGATGAVSLDGGTLLLNCEGIPDMPIPPIPGIPPIPMPHPDAFFNGSGWVNGGTEVLSTCSVVPGHEPWVGPDKIARPKAVSSGLIGLGLGVVSSVAGGSIGSSIGGLGI
jgi:hypothetical protein